MRWLTAGESHGKGLTVLIDDVPAGVPFSLEALHLDMSRRQLGYGRGGRMKIEKDTAEVTSGVRFGKTTGAPIALWIENRDFKNWESVMAVEGQAGEAAETRKFVRPRPGHADLAGYYKYGHADLRDVLERASARETAARVAAGAVAKMLLSALGVVVFSHVAVLGGVAAPSQPSDTQAGVDWHALRVRAESNDLRSAAPDDVLAAMRAAVDAALQAGTTLGGDIEIVALGLPPGLGSYVQWDRRLDGLLAQAVMSVQAVKAVSIGAGALGGQVSGDAFHDAMALAEGAVGQPPRLYRPTNRAGGLEGGVTNGMPLVLRAVMKPIATLRTALPSVNLETHAVEVAHFERSDVTAVPACGVVCEAMVSLVLARALMNKFGHDKLDDMTAAMAHYCDGLAPSP
jgi:chorismate synthase